MNKYQVSSSELQAKVIVLGDPNVGKSSFINALNPITNSSDDHKKFATVRIEAHEFERTDFDVDLKVWESGKGEFTDEQQDAVFIGSLFCIIMFDIRSRESSHSAFNKYLKMYKEHFPDSFLFVLGTHFDDAIHRQVQIAEASKYCAINDCIYLEISNEDGTNISLVRKLIVHKLNTLMQCHDGLQIRSKQLLAETRSILRQGVSGNNNSSSTNSTTNSVTSSPNPSSKGKKLAVNVMADNAHMPNINNENSHNNYSDTNNSPNGLRGDSSSKSDGQLIVPFFDEDIMTGSVGEILSSVLSTRHWPGLESSSNAAAAAHPNSKGKDRYHVGSGTAAVATANPYDTAEQLKYQSSGVIQGISAQLTSLLDRLGTDNKNIPRVPLDNSIGSAEDIAYTSIKMQQIQYQNQLRVQASSHALASTTPVVSSSNVSGHVNPHNGQTSRAGPSVPIDGTLNTNSGYEMSLSELQHAFSIMNLSLPMHLYNTDTTQLVQLDEVLKVATNTNDIASIQQLIPSNDVEPPPSDDTDPDRCHIIEITLKIAPDYATEHMLVINEHFDILRQVDSFIAQYTTNSVLNSHSKGNVTCNDIEALKESLVDCVFNIIKSKLMNSQKTRDRDAAQKSMVVLHNHHTMDHTMAYFQSNMMQSAADNSNSNDDSNSGSSDSREAIVTVVNIEYSSTQSIANASLVNNVILKRPFELYLPSGIRVERIVTIIKPVAMTTLTKTYLTDHTNNNILNVAQEIIRTYDLSHGYMNTLIDQIYQYIHTHMNEGEAGDDKGVGEEEGVLIDGEEGDVEDITAGGSNAAGGTTAEALSSI